MRSAPSGIIFHSSDVSDHGMQRDGGRGRE